jgi:hypothetical protein
MEAFIMPLRDLIAVLNVVYNNKYKGTAEIILQILKRELFSALNSANVLCCEQ